MTIEAALAANTAAVEKLTAILSGAGLAAKAEKPTKPAKAEKPAEAPPAAAAAEQPAPTYKDAANAVLKLSEVKGREAALELLKSFDATNLKGVDPSKYAELIEKAAA